MRQDVDNVASSPTAVLNQTLNVARGYPDVNRRHANCRALGNRFAGGGLSTARWMKVASGVIGKRPVNQ